MWGGNTCADRGASCSTQRVTPATKERVDDFWHGLFGEGSSCCTGHFAIVEHGEPLADFPGIYCVLRQQTGYVSAPAHLVETVTSWHPSVDAVVDAQWWGDRLPGWIALGPSVHSFLDRTDLLPVAGDTIVRAAEPDDLHQLRERVTQAEWAESGFAGDDITHAWVVVDQRGRPVAASNLTPFGDVPADVSVLADPSVRGHGVATVAAATASRHAVEHVGIARWRALATNKPSRRIAEKLGFEDDCIQLAVRPA